MATRNRSTAADQAEKRQNSAERRAAQLAALATQQADLKREAAERQAKRDLDAKSKKPTTGRGGAR